MDRTQSTLPLYIQVSYAIGQLGFATLISIISLHLVYFYLPPANADLPNYILTISLLGIFNPITLIAAMGRILDAVTDPLMASFSDRARFAWGRRIPFMAVSAVPSALFCVLVFTPPVKETSLINLIWLAISLSLFEIFMTMYATPYFALLAELGDTVEQRINLSTWMAVSAGLGLILSAQIVPLSQFIGENFQLLERLPSLQFSISVIAFVAVCFMLVPVMIIKERKMVRSRPTQQTMTESLRDILKNSNFRHYLVAAFAYFAGVSLVGTGLLYYVTVLLQMNEAFISTFIAVMILVSFALLPGANLLSKRYGKKRLVVLSLFMMSGVFLVITLLGHLPITAQVQGYIVAISFALPIAFLGMLANAIVSDLAKQDSLSGIEQREGMFFAARTLIQKMGQAAGVFAFTALLTFGRDPGDDLGIRLSGLLGFCLCIVAALVFTRYDEESIKRSLN